MAIDCAHLDTITAVPDGGDVCPTCVAMGSTWVNLRQCLACGQVGCCDSSPNTHATKHHQSTGHPIIRSVMPGQFIGQHLEGGGTLADVAPDLVVGDGFPLGTWLGTYRERAQRGDLRPDERAALKSVPGWTG